MSFSITVNPEYMVDEGVVVVVVVVAACVEEVDAVEVVDEVLATEVVCKLEADEVVLTYARCWASKTSAGVRGSSSDWSSCGASASLR